jgi:hypothetical protein
VPYHPLAIHERIFQIGRAVHWSDRVRGELLGVAERFCR